MDISQYIIIQQSCKSRMVFVTSIFTTGYAIGDFLWPVLYKVFLDLYSWRGSVLVQGALISNVAVLTLLQTSMVNDKGATVATKTDLMEEALIANHGSVKTKLNDSSESQKNSIKSLADEESNNKTDNNCKNIFSNLTWLDLQVTFAHFLYSFGDAFVHFMIAVRMHYTQLTQEQIVVVMSAGGLIGLSRIIPASMIDRLNLNRIRVEGIFCLLIGLITLVSVTFTTFPLVLTYFVAFGFLQCK